MKVALSSPSVRRQRKIPRRQIEPDAGMIEVEINGVTVRVGRGADARTVTAVLRAFKVVREQAIERESVFRLRRHLRLQRMGALDA